MNKTVFALVVSFGLVGGLVASSGCSKPAATEAAKVEKVEGSPTKLAVGQKVKCAVTGEEFVVSASTVQLEHDHKFYGFCCADCAPAFKKDPSKYVKTN